MSMNLMAQAMKIKVGNPIRKLILLKLADNANDQGECWPSVPYIAHQCEITDRSVQKHLHQLAADGLLWIEFRKNEQGMNKSNVYHLTLNNATKIKGENITPGEGTGSPPDESKTPGGVSGTRGSASGTPGRGESGTPRISHSFEPVIEPNTQTANKIHSIERGSGSSKPKGLIPNGERFSAQPHRAPAAPQTASTPLSSRYAFEGSVIRLNRQDFARWQAFFPHLELTAELTRLDLEFSHDRPKSWFSTASAKLNYQNKQAMGLGYSPPSVSLVVASNFR